MSEKDPKEQILKNAQEILSDQAGEIEIPTFWQLELKPNADGENEPVPVNFPDTTFLTLTNICLPEVTTPDNQPVDEPVRVFANVKGISDSRTLIATLIPGKIEHQIMNITFSPIDEVSIELKGKLPVHIVGVLNPDEEYYVFDDEEEEEEETKEEAKEEEKEK
ncbi:hypothetical protein M9Y10_012312 [Tritrichomonas musculus]|uniref:Nucleoplasmin-like domain-containing protein n=1 Tax=Tritrichomonas musculus TaxID=1915356 RepID=A0ABR2ICY6_9EUKA